MSFAEYTEYDATGLAELVRDKDIEAIELVEAAIERIERLNPAINAVIEPLFEQARAAAIAEEPSGPFAGVPFLLKDLMAAVEGRQTRDGSRSRRGVVYDHDSELVSRHKAAGLICVGRTNTPEFGMAPVTEPELFGPTRNPWNTDLTPCGSSGGSAAAVAAGFVPMAHGGDGGGSIRLPASACGLFGLKPTRARNPHGPDYSEAWFGLAQEHAISRSVRDSARLLDATRGPDLGAPYVAPEPGRPFAEEVGAEPGKMRIAFCKEALLGQQMHADCVSAVEEAASLCEELGHDVEEAKPALDNEEITDAFIKLVAADAAAQVEHSGKLTGRKPRMGEFESITWVLSRVGKVTNAGELAAALEITRHTSRTLAYFHETYDVFLTSTMGQPPWPIGALDPNPQEKVVLEAVKRVPAKPALQFLIAQMGNKILDPIPNTPLFNMTGQPAMSVPLTWNEADLPIGVQFVARFGDESMLFRLAAQLEAARPWWDHRPPLAEK